MNIEIAEKVREMKPVMSQMHIRYGNGTTCLVSCEIVKSSSKQYQNNINDNPTLG